MKTPLMLDDDVTKVPCAEPTCEVDAWLDCRTCWGVGFVSPDVRAATMKRIKEANDATSRT